MRMLVIGLATLLGTLACQAQAPRIGDKFNGYGIICKDKESTLKVLKDFERQVAQPSKFEQTGLNRRLVFKKSDGCDSRSVDAWMLRQTYVTEASTATNSFIRFSIVEVLPVKTVQENKFATEFLIEQEELSDLKL